MAIKIYIDQGHNPVNPNAGAEAFGLREQDIVYTIGKSLADLLTANGNFEVKLSRPTAETQLGSSIGTSLSARTDEANEWGADYFISLHANASEIQSASGSEAFVYSMSSPASVLADYMLRGLNEATGLRRRGVFARPGLWVLRKTKMPAVLLELGYITNPVDAELMSTQPELFAAGIYNGLLQYFGLS